MKKYLLTALLGVFGLFGFASAYTLDGFTSDSEIYSYTLSNQSSVDFTYFSDNLWQDFYVCFSTDDIPYYYNTYYVDSSLITSSIYCSPVVNVRNDDSFGFYSDFDYSNLKNISGKLYYSLSPITYSSSEGGDSEGSSSLISGGTTAFNGIITSLGSAVSEFIPYVVYIGIGLLGSIIGFVAIKRLINRVRAKIFGTFSGGRRK